MRLRTLLLAVIWIVIATFVAWLTVIAPTLIPEPDLVVHPVPAVKLDLWSPAFANGIEDDLSAGHYAKLESMAEEFRRPGALFVSGIPQLDIFYRVLSGHGSVQKYFGNCRAGVSDAAFKEKLPLLEAWHAVSPNSIAAKIALAELWLGYAWDARGCTYFDELTDARRSTIANRLSQVTWYLWRVDPTRDPNVYYLLIERGMLMGEQRDHLDNFYSYGVSIFPWYFPYYAQHAIFLLEQWFGAHGEEREYMNKLKTETRGVNGLIAYAFAVDRLNSVFPGDDDQLFKTIKLDFRIVVQAYQAREQQYGLRDRDWNVLFRLSLVSLKCEPAHTALLQIGDRWDGDLWSGDKKYFDDNVKWFHAHSRY